MITTLIIFSSTFMGVGAGMIVHRAVLLKHLKYLEESLYRESCEFKSGVEYAIEWIKAVL